MIPQHTGTGTLCSQTLPLLLRWLVVGVLAVGIRAGVRVRVLGNGMLLEGVLALGASGGCFLRRPHIAIAVAGLRLDGGRVSGSSVPLELLLVWVRETLGHESGGFVSGHDTRGGSETPATCAIPSVKRTHAEDERQCTGTRAVELVLGRTLRHARRRSIGGSDAISREALRDYAYLSVGTCVGDNGQRTTGSAVSFGIVGNLRESGLQGWVGEPFPTQDARLITFGEVDLLHERVQLLLVSLRIGSEDQRFVVLVSNVLLQVEDVKAVGFAESRLVGLAAWTLGGVGAAFLAHKYNVFVVVRAMDARHLLL